MNAKIRSLVRRALGRPAIVSPPAASPPAAPVGPWAGYTADALALAQWVDCDTADLDQMQQHPERVTAAVADRWCHWYLPSFESAYYGGVMTILRLAAHLRSVDGVRSRIFICGSCDPAVIAGKVAEAFPELADVAVIALDTPEALAAIPPSDYSVATLWTTAYVVLKVQNTGLKFYMIQDYEPLFYPAGSTYAQAELTYRFGFYGVANTVSLRDLYEKDYGGKAVVLTPNVDTRIFHPGPGLPSGGPRRLFYYARPGTPRNGFELAVAALRRLKERLGSQVEVICAGAEWRPEDYGLGGLVTAVGMLPYDQTGDLYRSCHVGLAMMMTKHPSYLPFEMMACGTLVVCNRNPANAWLLRDGENCLLAEPSASCLATTLERALLNHDAMLPIRTRGSELIREAHGDWAAALGRVADFMHGHSATL
jgi:O-antigen biosynthesis protein